MGLVTYLAIKLIAVAHDNEWAYLATGWGAWYLFEISVGVVLPLVLFARGIRGRDVGLIRFTAFVTIFGIVLNRLNTALVAFNWKLYQEIPHWKEFVIEIALFAVYIITYRFILYRLPILFGMKRQEAVAEAQERETAPVRGGGVGAPVAVFRSIDS
jgi:Ni/Fe-hydrogenase subunit HybB-like protein